MNKEIGTQKKKKSALSQGIQNVLEPPQGLKEGFLLSANLIKDNKDILEPPESLKEGAKKGANLVGSKNKMGAKIAALIAATIPCLLIF